MKNLILNIIFKTILAFNFIVAFIGVLIGVLNLFAFSTPLETGAILCFLSCVFLAMVYGWDVFLSRINSTYPMRK